MSRIILVITFIIAAGTILLLTQPDSLANPSTAATAETVIEAFATEEPTAEAPAVETREALLGDAERGADIFQNGTEDTPACSTCHGITRQAFGSRFAHNLGPNLYGLSERAGNRVEGLTAEEYIHNSIVNPGDYLVEGFDNQMYPLFGEQLSEQEIADLVAYAVTL
jgi:mono/diheme cytochrome c family protein